MSIQKSLPVNENDRLHIDLDYNITDDGEIRRLIETCGFHLVNEGKWKEVIHIHKKASGHVASTATYNMVLGIANYYSGFFIEALSFFKAANRLKSELNEGLKRYLQYFDYSAKAAIGILPYSDYLQKINDLSDEGPLSLYVDLENATPKYKEELQENQTEAFSNLHASISRIIAHPKADTSIKLNAMSELLLYQGHENTSHFARHYTMIGALEAGTGANSALRTELVRKFEGIHNTWLRSVEALQNDAIIQNNYFVYFAASVNEVNISYESMVYTNVLSTIGSGPPVKVMDVLDKELGTNIMLDKLDRSVAFFDLVGHIPNQIAAQSIRYKILHFLKKGESALEVIRQMKDMIEQNDLTDERNRLEYLINGGTTHEGLQEHINQARQQFIETKRGVDDLVGQMRVMDQLEKRPNGMQEDHLSINLFPIGNFQFPSNQKDKIYQILNITPEAQTLFDVLFNTVTPIANIFHDPIMYEGQLDRNSKDQGIVNWKRIFEIRKAFFENRFFRI